MKRICLLIALLLAEVTAAAQDSTMTSSRDSAAVTAVPVAVPAIAGEPVTGAARLRHPRATWAVAAGAGACAAAAGFCVLKSNGAYDRYQAAATAGEMLSWRDRATAYDRAAFAAGVMAGTLAAVWYSLYTMRTGGVAVGLGVPTGRCGLVVAGRF